MQPAVVGILQTVWSADFANLSFISVLSALNEQVMLNHILRMPILV